MSTVDVIIPCYGYGRFLRSCVKSVLAQEGVEVRILIIDDASPDETPEMAAELASKDQRIEVRRHAENRGHIATYNEGLEWVQGDYTVLLSADDMLTPGSLRRAAQLMDENPDVGFTYGPAILFQSEDPLAEAQVGDARDGWKIISGRELLVTACAMGHMEIQSPTVMVRTRLQKKVGGYRAELPHSGDTEMWLRFAAHGRVGVLEAPQAFYRMHGTNMVLKYLGGEGMLQHRAAFSIHFREYAELIPDRARLRRIVDQAVADVILGKADRAFSRGDLVSCERYLSLARSIDYRVRFWPAWWRLMCKRLVGPTIWSAVSPILRYVRGRRHVLDGRHH